MDFPVGTRAPASRPENQVEAGSLDRAPAGRTAFRLYFDELSATTRLSPTEELAAVLELRRSRRALWEALLREPSLLPSMLDVVSGVLPSRRTPKRLASTLRQLAASAHDDAIAQTRARMAREVVDADRDMQAASAALTLMREHAEPGTRPRDRCERAFAALERTRDAFVTANLGLVVAVVNRHRNRGLSYLDLVQEGNAGLLKAVDRFDPRHGVRFSTYAVWWIRHGIGRALADKGREIRLPVHLVERRQLLARARASFEREHGRAPSLVELARAVAMSRLKVERALSASWERATGLDLNTGRIGPLDVETLADPAEDADRHIDGVRLAKALDGLVGELPPMQRDVLRHRFGLDGSPAMTLREIGEIHGLSRERIRQIQNRALTTLRWALRRQGIGREVVEND